MNMTKSVIPQDTSESNRVDPPHNLAAVSPEGTPSEKSANAWMAYAGRDPASVARQVDSQANELMSYVQGQNKEIDDRQAELNAKLAQLDSQLRSARLQGVDGVGTDLLADANSPTPSNASSTAPRQTQTPVAVDDSVISKPINFEQPPDVAKRVNQEFDEVDRIVAQFSGHAETGDASVDDLWNEALNTKDAQPDHRRGDVASLCNESDSYLTASDQADASEIPPHAVETATKIFGRESIDAFPQMLADSHLRRLVSIPTSEVDTVESQRRLLAERNLELERQKSIVGRLQDEAQALYREALEMRIVTEQLWGKLSHSTPPTKLQEIISSLRARLEAHYAKESEAMANRKNELQAMQKGLGEKQASLREQSARMQEWFSTREEQLRSYSNEIDARSALLDQREQRLQLEFAKWQATRKDYESQLQGLAQMLKTHGIAPPA